MIAVGQRDPLLASPDPAAPCARQQALVEQRAGPCPAAVISFNQTNMIEPRATLQWRHGHSLLLLVRNPNPSIHRRDSRSIYILRLTAVVPGWMRCVWQKKRLQTCRGAALVSQPSANSREGRENGTQTLLPSAFGCLGGWSCAPRCNLCSQAGTRQQQEQRPACAGQGPRLRRLLPSPPGTVSSTNPQLSCIVIRLPAGIGVLCITEAGRTVGLLSQRMGWDCLFVPGHASLLSYNKDNTRLSRAHLSRAKKPHYCLRWTGQPNRGSG